MNRKIKGIVRILFLLVLILISGLVFSLSGQPHADFIQTDTSVAFAQPSYHDPVIWQISGSNTVRSEYYHVTGDETASPYQFEGLQSFDELNLGFNVKKSPFTTSRGQVFGVFNDSDYRSTDKGFIPERINLFHEKGDSPIPYRLELGDFFGFYSYRTLQRSLKGLQVEIQPGAPKNRHSILLTSGSSQPSWRDFEPSDNYTNGCSFLLDDSVLGQLSFNFVHNTRQADQVAALPRRNQIVSGVAAMKTLQLMKQRLTLEAEVSHFRGDPDNSLASDSDQENKDELKENGLYLQVSGQIGLPLTYRFRYEEYGQDYRPEGAVVTPGRRSSEGNAGWRFRDGLEIRGRVQNFQDGYDSQNSTDSTTYGLTLSGPIMIELMKSLSGHLDTFHQGVENEDKTTNYVVQSVNLNLNKPVPLGWNARLGLSYQERDDKTTASINSITREANLGADHSLTVFGFQGSISPGFVSIKINNQTESREFFPTLAINQWC